MAFRCRLVLPMGAGGNTRHSLHRKFRRGCRRGEGAVALRGPTGGRFCVHANYEGVIKSRRTTADAQSGKYQATGVSHCTSHRLPKQVINGLSPPLVVSISLSLSLLPQPSKTLAVPASRRFREATGAAARQPDFSLLPMFARAVLHSLLPHTGRIALGGSNVVS